MMREDSQQPIFGEAAQKQLPVIDRTDFIEYLDSQFAATGKPADEQALGHLLNLTHAHPRGTQQLAWEVRSDTGAGQPVTLDSVIRAHDRLVQTIERSEYAAVLNVLISGDEGEVNEIRALQLLADRGGKTISSRPVARLYGFSSHSRVRPALERLQGAGSSSSEAAPGTSSIHCSRNGSSAPLRWRTGRCPSSPTGRRSTVPSAGTVLYRLLGTLSPEPQD